MLDCDIKSNRNKNANTLCPITVAILYIKFTCN